MTFDGEFSWDLMGFYNRESHLEVDDLGFPLFQETPCEQGSKDAM